MRYITLVLMMVTILAGSASASPPQIDSGALKGEQMALSRAGRSISALTPATTSSATPTLNLKVECPKDRVATTSEERLACAEKDIDVLYTAIKPNAKK